MNTKLQGYFQICFSAPLMENLKFCAVYIVVFFSEKLKINDLFFLQVYMNSPIADVF